MRYNKTAQSENFCILPCDTWLQKATDTVIEAAIASYPIVNLQENERLFHYKTEDIALAVRTIKRLVDDKVSYFNIKLFFDCSNLYTGFDLVLQK